MNHDTESRHKLMMKHSKGDMVDIYLALLGKHNELKAEHEAQIELSGRKIPSPHLDNYRGNVKTLIRNLRKIKERSNREAKFRTNYGTKFGAR